MRPLIAIASLAALTACMSPNPDRGDKAFSAFPDPQIDSFDCIFTLPGEPEAIILGTDASDPEQQAFVYYGNETLRLRALEPVELGLGNGPHEYAVFDYNEFRLTLAVEPLGNEAFSGSIGMSRKSGDEIYPIADPIAVEGTCAG